MTMFNDIDWTRKGNDEVCISNSEKVKTCAKRFSQGHWTFFGLGDEKKWYGKCTYNPEGKWKYAASRMVQQFKGTGHPAFTSASALSRGILRMLKRKSNHTLQCGCFKHRTLVPNHPFCKSAQYLRSSFELVLAIRFESGREGTRKHSRKKRTREQRNTKEREFTRRELFGVFSKTRIWKQTAGKHSRLRITVIDYSMHKRFANSHRSGTKYRLVWATRQNLTRTTVLEIQSQYAENTHFLEQTTIQGLCNNSWRNN